MKRLTGMALLAAVLSGCVTDGTNPNASGQLGCSGGMPLTVPGVQGAWGSPVPMSFPYTAAPPSSPGAAYAMMMRSVPLDRVQMAGLPVPNTPSGVTQASAYAPAGAPSGVVQAGGFCPPGGCPGGPMPPGGPIAPPGLGFAPGMPPPPPAAVAAVGALTGSGAPSPFSTRRTEVRFVSPTGMKVAWFGGGSSGQTGAVSNQLEVPGRYNFIQAAIYRLKLSDIANRPGLELYPTLEVVPSNIKTDSFLAHSAVPVAFSEEDFEQVAAGNFVVKVIYLPDPAFQDLATTGLGEIVSTRLEPGVDPISEAYRRGSILVIVRLGNIDLEAPNTPSMDAPSPYPEHGAIPPGPQCTALPAQSPAPEGVNGPGRATASSNGPLMATPNPAYLAGRSGMVGAPPGTLVGPNGMLFGPNGPIQQPRGPGMLPPSLPVQPANPLAIPNGSSSSAAPTNGLDRTAIQQANFPAPSNQLPVSVLAAREAAQSSKAAEAKKPNRLRRWLLGMKDDAPKYPDPFDASQAPAKPAAGNSSLSPVKEPDTLPLPTSSGPAAQGTAIPWGPAALAASTMPVPSDQGSLASSVPMQGPAADVHQGKKASAADQWMLGIKSFEPVP